jgi:predicted O-methyltransferase YrrM
MSQDTWTAVDRYITDSLIPPDHVLVETLETNAASGLPAIDVAPNQGKLLYLLAKIHQAGRILEIGTLGGYSTIWLARALPPQGRLVTLEADARHAEVATANIARAGLSEIVELRLGVALESLSQLQKERAAPFDFIFIDADKVNNASYLDRALRLSRVGTVIVVDNVVREGALIEADSQDLSVQGSRRLFERMAADPRLDATALQTVGIKGYDGFALAVVKAV